jgi:hypothetical protein
VPNRRTLLVAALVAATLLAVDVAFIVLNFASLDVSGDRLTSRHLYVGGEWSVPEIVQYAKWAVLAALAAITYRASREPAYGIWALGFGVAGVDDALALHERAGRLIADSQLIAARPGLIEIGVLTLASVTFVAALTYVHRRLRHSPLTVQHSRRALGMMAAYALFGVGFDALQVVHRGWAPDDRYADVVIGLLENSGELVVLSLLVGVTLLHARRLARPSTSQSD